MKKYLILKSLIIILFIVINCQNKNEINQKPNVILKCETIVLPHSLIVPISKKKIL